jgi:hypothetical protein
MQTAAPATARKRITGAASGERVLSGRLADRGLADRQSAWPYGSGQRQRRAEIKRTATLIHDKVRNELTPVGTGSPGRLCWALAATGNAAEQQVGQVGQRRRTAGDEGRATNGGRRTAGDEGRATNGGRRRAGDEGRATNGAGRRGAVRLRVYNMAQDLATSVDRIARASAKHGSMGRPADSIHRVDRPRRGRRTLQSWQ